LGCLASPVPSPGHTPAEKNHNTIIKEGSLTFHKAIDLQSDVLQHAINLRKQGLPVTHMKGAYIGNLYDNGAYVSATDKMLQHREQVQNTKSQAWQHYQALKSAGSGKHKEALKLHTALQSAHEVLQEPPIDHDAMRRLGIMSKGHVPAASTKVTSDLDHRLKVVNDVRKELPKTGSSLLIQQSRWFKGQSSS
jgi:hypothetical protein